MSKKKTYQSSFKVQVVMESFQRDTTIESVRMKYQVPTTVINTWRSLFKKHAHEVFESNSRPKKQEPGTSPDELKRIIGELTIENALLKKASSVWA